MSKNMHRKRDAHAAVRLQSAFRGAQRRRRIKDSKVLFTCVRCQLSTFESSTKNAMVFEGTTDSLAIALAWIQG